MPLKLQNPYGPLQAGYRAICRDRELVEGLNAVQRRLHRSMGDIVLRICLEYYLPSWGVEVRGSGPSCTEHQHLVLMDHLRWHKESEGHSVSKLVTESVRQWLHSYVAAIDTHGAVWTDEEPPERLYAPMPSPRSMGARSPFDAPVTVEPSARIDAYLDKVGPNVIAFANDSSIAVEPVMTDELRGAVDIFHDD